MTGTPVFQWAETNQGLGGWVGSILAVAAILFAFFISRAEYKRDRRQDIDRHNTLVGLIDDTVTRYEQFVMPYFAAAKASLTGPAVPVTFHGFGSRNINHPTTVAFSNVARMELLQWPSAASFLTFRAYLTLTNDMVGRSNVLGAMTFTSQELKERADHLSAFKANLAAARRSA